MNAGSARRMLALVGGVLLGVGADSAEGPETRSGFLVAGIGVGLIAAALVRD